MRKEGIVVPRFTINTVLEDGNHGLVCLFVKVVDFVAFIEQIGDNVGRWAIDNSGRY